MAQHKPFAAAAFFLFVFVSHYFFRSSNTQMVWLMASLCIPQLGEKLHGIPPPNTLLPLSPVFLASDHHLPFSPSSFSKTPPPTFFSAHKHLPSVRCFILLQPMAHDGSYIYALPLLNVPPLLFH